VPVRFFVRLCPFVCSGCLFFCVFFCGASCPKRDFCEVSAICAFCAIRAICASWSIVTDV
jgi:hypothetical protein